MSLTPRERALRALSLKKPDRVPKWMSFTPPMLDRFKEKTGAEDPPSYFEMEFREAAPDSTKKETDFRKYFASYPKNLDIDEWGVGYVKGSLYHFKKRVPPMEKFTKTEEVEDYPFPDLDAPYRYERLKEKVRRIHGKGLAVIGWGSPSIFEQSWYLRGMDKLFFDFIENPSLAEALLDRITHIVTESNVHLAQAEVDVIVLGDDIGAQNQMLMSPDMWRRWLKPRLSKVIHRVKQARPSTYIYYHSDGVIDPIIPDLIEVGVQILNPIQPECMSPYQLKKKYGKSLAFWGCVGTQTTFPFGTPEEVKSTVREIIHKVGTGGGLVIAPTHVVEPDVPWENILAFFEGVEEYGECSG